MSSTDNTNAAPPNVPRWLLKAVTRLNVVVYRVSGGRLMNKMAGWPICLVNMTGAKSGRAITVPLMYVPYKEGMLLVASQGGAPRNPVWYRNLVKKPDISIEQGGRKLAVRAIEISGEEKLAAWAVCDAHYPPYADYRKRTDRDIPVFSCQPKQL